MLVTFEGDFIRPNYPNSGPQPVDFLVFGKHIPFDAKFNGTFSYDTTSDGVIPFPNEPNIKDFKQKILGGFAFNIFSHDGTTSFFQLRANEFIVRVTNDHTAAGAPVATDLVSIQFDPTMPLILKDDVPYTRATTMTVPISWDSSTFSDLDEPRLHDELPPTNFVFPGNMFAAGSASFQITSISPIESYPGDYNLDNRFDVRDRDEWRKAFGRTGDTYSYADGNRDGVIDSADYVIWRRATDTWNANGTIAIPEPSTLALIATGALVLAASRRKRLS